MKQLVEQSGLLDQLDDRISEAIGYVEAALQGCISIRLTQQIWFSEHDNSYQALVFGKQNGRWGLAIEEGRIGNDGDHWPVDWTPLTNCSRDKRCEVFAEGHIEQLLRGALKKFEEEIKLRRTALATVDRVMSVLNGIQVRPPQPASSKAPNGPDDDIPF